MTTTVLAASGVNPVVLAEALRPAPGCREAVFQTAVIEFARACGFRVAHFRPARVRRGGKDIYETPVAADGKGWPDLVLVKAGRLDAGRTGRLIFAELKTATGEMSPDQEKWFNVLTYTHTGHEVYLWRPANWDDIVATLMKGNHPDA